MNTLIISVEVGKELDKTMQETNTQEKDNETAKS